VLKVELPEGVAFVMLVVPNIVSIFFFEVRFSIAFCVRGFLVYERLFTAELRRRGRAAYDRRLERSARRAGYFRRYGILSFLGLRHFWVGGSGRGSAGNL